MAKKDVGGFDVPMNYIGSMNKVYTAKYIIHYDYHVLLIDVEPIHIVNQRLQIWLNMFHYNKNVFYWLRVIIVYFRNNNIINVRCKLVILDLWKFPEYINFTEFFLSIVSSFELVFHHFNGYYLLWRLMNSFDNLSKRALANHWDKLIIIFLLQYVPDFINFDYVFAFFVHFNN